VQPLKADPFAFASELRPKTASLTARPAKPNGAMMRTARTGPASIPGASLISIYEVHPGSWQRDDNGWFLTWDEMAARLIPYVADMGFTHIEFLPVSEHPYDPSGATRPPGSMRHRPGSAMSDGFARFVDGAHRAGIGVLIDWVPAHFPVDEHGLARFDGTALYEHEDPRLGFHPTGTPRSTISAGARCASFLVNNALFWAEQYHVDGLRVDAVASMLYRDYSRKAGEWIPNAKAAARTGRRWISCAP
jgi:1,4-alpha-glucan branching enzyme